jgi:hypothetical protein
MTRLRAGTAACLHDGVHVLSPDGSNIGDNSNGGDRISVLVTRLRVMAAQVLAVLIACSPLVPVAAADRDQAAVANASAVKTGKERLTDKASDEQRVDDCKVAQARRTRPRPTGCAGGAGG